MGGVAGQPQQKVLQRIERSLRPTPNHPAGGGCFAPADTLIRFGDPDRSIKRPDLGADGAPFYLASGVQDVLIFDPRSGAVYHDTVGCERRMLSSPVTIDLSCGCRVTVA